MTWQSNQRETPPAAPPNRAERRLPSRRADHLGCILVGLLLLAQFLLFGQYVVREVAWSWPTNHDQLNFLEPSYAAYQRVLEAGPKEALREQLSVHRPRAAKESPGSVVLPERPRENPTDEPVRTAQGLMLPLQATIIYIITGPNRLTALSLNFFYFAVFQCALVATLRWLTGRWSIALLGLGLLLLARTTFYYAGGVADFRVDFIGLSLFGTFLCLVIRSRVFQDRSWSLAAAAAAALLFSFRFLALVYLGGILAVLGVIFLLRLRRAEDRKLAVRPLMNWLLASAVLAAVAIPVVAQRWKPIREYYFVGHVSGPEKRIRAQEQGVTDRWSAMTFYPKSLVKDHGGTPLLTAAALLIALAIVVRVVGGARSKWRPGSARASPSLWDAIVLVAAAFLVPLVVLTADVARSPVVADVMVPPSILLMMLAAISLIGAHHDAGLSAAERVSLAALSSVVLLAGMIAQSDGYGRRTAVSYDRPQVQKLLALYDTAAEACAAMGWHTPDFAIDRTSDSLHCKAFEVMAFERHRQLFRGREVLAENILGRSAEEDLARLPLADLVVLTDGPPPRFEYPFDRTMRQIKPQVREWCRENLIELRHEHLGDPINCDATLFIRPAVRVDAEPDGWIAARGMRIVALAQVLRAMPHLELFGPNESAYLGGRVPRVAAHVRAGERSLGDTPAEMNYAGNEYRLSLRLDPSRLPASGAVALDLEFDASFVPHDVNRSTDQRHLVMRLPTRALMDR